MWGARKVPCVTLCSSQHLHIGVPKTSLVNSMQLGHCPESKSRVFFLQGLCCIFAADLFHFAFRAAQLCSATTAPSISSSSLVPKARGGAGGGPHIKPRPRVKKRGPGSHSWHHENVLGWFVFGPRKVNERGWGVHHIWPWGQKWVWET